MVAATNRQISEVRTAIPPAISSTARPPERTAAAVLRLSAHRRVLELQGGGRRAMMLAGLAQHNQPQRQRARPCPIITSLAQNKLLHHLREAQLVCFCLRRLPRRRSTTTDTSDNLARHIASALPSSSLSSTTTDPRFPNQSHARDNNLLRADSWARIQQHILARTIYQSRDAITPAFRITTHQHRQNDWRSMVRKTATLPGYVYRC
jgi:hypothetical protein